MSGQINLEIRNSSQFIDLARKLPRSNHINDFIILYETVHGMCTGCRKSQIPRILEELELRYLKCATAEKLAITSFANAQNQEIKLFFNEQLFFQT